MTTLSPAQRKELKGRAHHLDPLVIIGDKGLAPTVMAEIDRALRTHELIKIRVTGDDRDQRGEIMAEICREAQAQPVQIIGKLLVVYRERSLEESESMARFNLERKNRLSAKRRAADAAKARQDVALRERSSPSTRAARPAYKTDTARPITARPTNARVGAVREGAVAPRGPRPGTAPRQGAFGPDAERLPPRATPRPAPRTYADRLESSKRDEGFDSAPPRKPRSVAPEGFPERIERAAVPRTSAFKKPLGEGFGSRPPARSPARPATGDSAGSSSIASRSRQPVETFDPRPIRAPVTATSPTPRVSKFGLGAGLSAGRGGGGGRGGDAGGGKPPTKRGPRR